MPSEQSVQSKSTYPPEKNGAFPSAIDEVTQESTTLEQQQEPREQVQKSDELYRQETTPSEEKTPEAKDLDTDTPEQSREAMLAIQLTDARSTYARVWLHEDEAPQEEKDRVTSDYFAAVSAVRAEKKAAFAPNASWSPQEYVRHMEQMILSTTAHEARALYDARTAAKRDEQDQAAREKSSLPSYILEDYKEAFAMYGRASRHVAEWYRSIPPWQKIAIGGTLFGATAGGAYLGLPLLAAAGGSARLAQRMLAGGSAALAGEGLTQVFQETKAKKEIFQDKAKKETHWTPKILNPFSFRRDMAEDEAVKWSGKLEALLQEDNDERLNNLILEQAGRMGKEARTRAVVAGAVFGAIALGAPGKIFRGVASEVMSTSVGQEIATAGRSFGQSLKEWITPRSAYGDTLHPEPTDADTANINAGQNTSTPDMKVNRFKEFFAAPGARTVEAIPNQSTNISTNAINPEQGRPAQIKAWISSTWKKYMLGGTHENPSGETTLASRTGQMPNGDLTDEAKRQALQRQTPQSNPQEAATQKAALLQERKNLQKEYVEHRAHIDELKHQQEHDKLPTASSGKLEEQIRTEEAQYEKRFDELDAKIAQLDAQASGIQAQQPSAAEQARVQAEVRAQQLRAERTAKILSNEQVQQFQKETDDIEIKIREDDVTLETEKNPAKISLIKREIKSFQRRQYALAKNISASEIAKRETRIDELKTSLDKSTEPAEKEGLQKTIKSTEMLLDEERKRYANIETLEKALDAPQTTIPPKTSPPNPQITHEPRHNFSNESLTPEVRERMNELLIRYPKEIIAMEKELATATDTNERNRLISWINDKNYVIHNIQEKLAANPLPPTPEPPPKPRAETPPAANALTRQQVIAMIEKTEHARALAPRQLNELQTAQKTLGDEWRELKKQQQQFPTNQSISLKIGEVEDSFRQVTKEIEKPRTPPTGSHDPAEPPKPAPTPAQQGAKGARAPVAHAEKNKSRTGTGTGKHEPSTPKKDKVIPAPEPWSKEQLITAQKGDSYYTMVRRQLYEEMRADAQAHPDKFGITAEDAKKLPEHMPPKTAGMNTKILKRLDNQTMNILEDPRNKIILKDRTETRIAQQRVKIILNKDGTINPAEGQGKTTYQWHETHQAKTSAGHHHDPQGEKVRTGVDPTSKGVQPTPDIHGSGHTAGSGQPEAGTGRGVSTTEASVFNPENVKTNIKNLKMNVWYNPKEWDDLEKKTRVDTFIKRVGQLGKEFPASRVDGASPAYSTDTVRGGVLEERQMSRLSKLAEILKKQVELPRDKKLTLEQVFQKYQFKGKLP